LQGKEELGGMEMMWVALVVVGDGEGGCELGVRERLDGD